MRENSDSRDDLNIQQISCVRGGNSPANTMPSPYERLQAKPQTGLNIGSLTPTQRSEVRTLRITSSWPIGPNSIDCRTIYYLEGDEQAAVELFVEEHRDQLEEIDWTKRNPIKSSLSQVIYDKILHELGERRISKTETMVREDRPNGDVWLIDRKWYENRPDRRYSVTPHKSAPKVAKLAGQSPENVLKEIDSEIITESAVRSYVEGDKRLLLEYLRTSDKIACLPITHDGEMAVKLFPDQSTAVRENSEEQGTQ